MTLRSVLLSLGLVLLPSPMYAPPLPAAARLPTREAYTRARTYAISPALSQEILSAAAAEHIPTRVAYRLVRRESGFKVRAVGGSGEIGLVQILPSTALLLNPRITRSQLFDPHTNLHLGFRYLSKMHHRYRGDWNRALIGYNSGPGVADTIVIPRDSITYATNILH